MLTLETKNVLLARLEEDDEGFRQFAYDDATGDRVRAPKGNLTIGIGFNLDVGCPRELARIIARYFIDANDTLLSKLFTVYNDLNQVRQCVLVNMMFNLGFNRFAKFEQFFHMIEKQDFIAAAKEMRNSHWYEQVTHRAEHLAREMEQGIFLSDSEAHL